MAQHKGDSYCDIPNYIRHYVESTERGHIIKILTESGLKTFNCTWQKNQYQRTKPITWKK